MKYVLFALLIWFVFQFLVRLVIPLFKVTRKFKKGFREMHEKMNEQYGPKQKAYSSPAQPTAPKTSPGDYLEFEDIK